VNSHYPMSLKLALVGAVGGAAILIFEVLTSTSYSSNPPNFMILLGVVIEAVSLLTVGAALTDHEPRLNREDASS